MSVSNNPKFDVHDEVVSYAEDLRAEIRRCGGVQLHIGPMSLRFSRESFKRLVVFVNSIQCRLLELDLNQSKPN
jgi:hypothetical protein